MPFPFLWGGAALALAFLAAVMIVFGVAAKLLGVATTGLRGSVLPGLVDGLRDWGDRPNGAVIVEPGAGEDGSGMPPAPDDPAPTVERLRPRVR
jgi:hypothetical protein